LITSTQNPQIKLIEALIKKGRERDNSGLFVVEGKRICEDFIASGAMVEKVYYSEKCVNGDGSLCHNYPTEVLSDKVFATVSDTVNPQGILMLVKMPKYSLNDITSKNIKNGSSVLILENIQDPGNLGTMMRTAEAAGVSGIVLSKGSVDMFNPKVVRSTMGALCRLPFIYTDDIQTTVRDIKKAGFTTYAAHLKGKDLGKGFNFEKKSAIMIGNEANGLSDEISALADVKVRIPMEGKAESLNAAVAAALFMYGAYLGRN